MNAPEPSPLVLLIDDSPAIHRLMAFKLRNQGIELLTALSGEEGVELARSHQPMLILLDLNMPGMSGLDALRALKNDPATIQIPVIIVSGTTNSSEKVMAFEIGAQDFVTKPFDASELRARIGSAIRISRLLKMLEQRAQIDGLTGLWNRAYFNQRLGSEIDSALRRTAPLSLVMCDLDHFKRMNDTFGHPAGDAVLQSFASILLSELRSYDVPCRYGGEEFAIILPDTPPVESVEACERIRQRLLAQRWPGFPEMVSPGCSFGVTGVPVIAPEDPASWLAAADSALYQSKQSGRNRVTVAEAPAVELRRAG